MFVGDNEILLSDTLDVANLAKDYNDVEVYNFKGMFHVFLWLLRKCHLVELFGKL